MNPGPVSLADGTTGELVARGDWSWEVRHLTGPSPERWVERATSAAAADGVLDLRSRTPLPGSMPLDGGEHVLPVRLLLPDLPATRALGRYLAGVLLPGDLVVLDGPLGAGKTSLVQGIGEALGVRGRVCSPTFVLARAHRGPLPLVHVDAYRLLEAGARGLDDLDLDVALEDGVVVVEWGSGLVEHLAPAHLRIEIARPPAGPDELVEPGRTATVRGLGRRWAVLPGR